MAGDVVIRHRAGFVKRAHATRLPLRLSRRHERWLYVTGALLWGSGLGWLICHYFFTTAAEFADAPNPWEPWWLRLHGAAMIAFLVVVGALFPGHLVHGWRRRTNYRSGILMCSTVAVLVLTGYGLYYAGNERIRAWTSVAHWGAGLAAAAALSAHVILGKRSRQQRRLSYRHP